MPSRLANVRLDEDRLAKARRLREHGVTLSDFVRDAIDERFARLRASQTPPDVEAVLADVFERYPDPAGLPARRYDVHDRRQARDAVRRGMRRKRR